MAIPDFLAEIRRLVGTRRLLLPGVAALVTDPRGRLLMIRRGDTGHWSLPAGIVEPGEEPSFTVARELHEETGLVAVPDRIAAVVDGPHVVYPNGDDCHFVTTYYVCRVVGGEMRPDGGEATDVAWLDPTDPRAAGRLAWLPRPLEELLAAEAAHFPWDDAWLDGLD